MVPSNEEEESWSETVKACYRRASMRDPEAGELYFKVAVLTYDPLEQFLLHAKKSHDLNATSRHTC